MCLVVLGSDEERPNTGDMRDARERCCCSEHQLGKVWLAASSCKPLASCYFPVSALHRFACFVSCSHLSGPQFSATPKGDVCALLAGTPLFG